MQERNNIRNAKIIEQAVALDADMGAAHAWVFLTFHGIPPEIAARVLAESGQRRATDRTAATLSVFNGSTQG